jgi:aminoglycoside 3-N-acetyltransferase
MVTADDIRKAVQRLKVSGQALCVHASLRAFGWVEGGAPAAVGALLAEDCTVLVPTFSADTFAISPPPGMRPARNGWDYTLPGSAGPGSGRLYSPDTAAIDERMGAIPKVVVETPGRVRGNHPLCSFSAIGPRAAQLIEGQAPLRVFAPLSALAEGGGSVVLIGVSLNRMTLLHLAEQRAGRRLFRRWANGTDGHPMELEVGSCSEGFGNFEPVLAPFRRKVRVGKSLWHVFPADRTVEVAVSAIRRAPRVTHCGDGACSRCNDAVLGGPLPLIPQS